MVHGITTLTVTNAMIPYPIQVLSVRGAATSITAPIAASKSTPFSRVSMQKPIMTPQRMAHRTRCVWNQTRNAQIATAKKKKNKSSLYG
jgi:hypothetical protein